ncbi:MAG TPA: hypothetical protein VFG86_00440 [Chloroflexota bacterium]|nr:hypothetical protein [Chloroflexota bacterium]
MARLLRRRPDATGPERAARWLRERLEREARTHYAWLDGGIWASAVHGAPRDTKQAAARLTNASLLGDEVA